MNNSAQKTYEVNGSEPILIVDKIGAIGEALAREFSKDFLVVLVSKNVPFEKSDKTIHVAFKRKIPQVPDSKYSKIFLVDDGEIVTKESAFSFVEMAKRNNAPVYFIGSIRNVDIEHADQVVTSYRYSKILIFGDLFDKTIFFDKSETINRYILQARKNQRIGVEGNGLALSFPITFNDTIKLIIKASYLNIPQKIILLFYEHPITDISLANTFKKVNPNIKVDFIKGENDDRKIYIPKGAQHAISKYSLGQKIKELELEDKENREIRVVGRRRRRGFLRLIIFVSLIGIFILLLPIGMTLTYAALGKSRLQSVGKEVEKGNLDKAIKNSSQAQIFFETAEKLSKPLLIEAKVFNVSAAGDMYLVKIESGRDLSTAVSSLLDGASTLSRIYSGQSKDPKEDFSSASNSLKSGLFLIQKIKAEGNLPKEFEQEVDNLTPFIDLFANSSEVLPEMLGFDGEKTYLVLFQNNLELRPGGGYIGAYGILKVKNGKVVDFKIADTYTLDSKLKAHVEPPFPIRRYLPSAHSFLRDSNFDPDFIKSSISVANLYTIETQQRIDGVIGVDYNFAKNMFKVLGPVNLSTVNKTIDENNLNENVYQDSLENNGQKTQKSDFFELLAKGMVNSLKNNKKIPYLLLAQNLGKSIAEKNINFAYQSPNVQDVFTANGWSSSLWDNRQNNDQTINDYLGFSESNLGNNSVNYNISRSVSKKTIILDNGKVSSRTTISFKNNSKGGEVNSIYKNYLRIIVPDGSRITSISINSKDEKIVDAVTDPNVYERIGYKPPIGIEVEGEKELGKDVYGLFIQVLPGELKTISILYELPYSVTRSQKSINYSLKIYKQPGIDSYPFDLSFSLPQGYKVINNTNPYSTEIIKDEDFMFLIAQN